MIGHIFCDFSVVLKVCVDPAQCATVTISFDKVSRRTGQSKWSNIPKLNSSLKAGRIIGCQLQ